jgi:inner membrane protein
MVFISGQLSFDTLDGVSLPRDPYQFPFIRATDTSITLEAAPLAIVQSKLGEEFATGQLQVKVINTSSQ